MKTAEGVKLRGWDALKIKLEQKGLSSTRIEQAKDSFHEGMEVLSRLFLSYYEVRKKNHALPGAVKDAEKIAQRNIVLTNPDK